MDAEGLSRADSFFYGGLITTGIFGLLLLVLFVQRVGRTKLEGVVVDHEENDDDSTTYYRPVIEYTTPSGDKRRTLHSLSRAKRLEVGVKRITVWHHENPDKTHAEEPMMPFPIWMLGILPIAALVIGVVLRSK